MRVNASDIVKTLWEEGFFKTEKTFKDILFAVNKRGYNPNTATLHNATRRANFLTRKGSTGHYRYIQKFNCHDSHELSDSSKSNGLKLLKERGTHPKIIQVSGKLFADGHYSQAIFEGFKAVNNMVKEKSGLTGHDGKDLMAQAFKPASPILRWSKLTTESEKNEQEGFMFLFMGAIVGVRNPKAHDEIIQRDKIKTLEYLSLASLLAKRVNEAEKSDSIKTKRRI